MAQLIRTLFSEIEATIFRSLKERDSDELQILTDALDGFLSRSYTDALGDIFALSVFCTMRKMAFEEVYIEVTDRNPLFNDQADQAAAFAELFALGSRCESYFDITTAKSTINHLSSRKATLHSAQHMRKRKLMSTLTTKHLRCRHINASHS
jgi:hypothetical protein